MTAHQVAHSIHQSKSVHTKESSPQVQENQQSPFERKRKMVGNQGMRQWLSQSKKEDKQERLIQKDLPSQVRSKMESKFGMDFSTVKISENPTLAKVGAKAFAQGNHLSFAPGEFRPNSQSGQSLLGHELAHIAQQRSGRVSRSKGTGFHVDHSLEKEADKAGKQAANGELVSLPGSASRSSVSASTSDAPAQPFLGGLLSAGKKLLQSDTVKNLAGKAINAGKQFVQDGGLQKIGGMASNFLGGGGGGAEPETAGGLPPTGSYGESEGGKKGGFLEALKDGAKGAFNTFNEGGGMDMLKGAASSGFSAFKASREGKSGTEGLGGSLMSGLKGGFSSFQKSGGLGLMKNSATSGAGRFKKRYAAG